MLAFANNFLAGSLLTLVLPVFAFLMILGLLTYMVVHVSETRPEDAPGAGQPASAGGTATGQHGGDAGRSV